MQVKNVATENEELDPDRWLDLYGDYLFRYAVMHLKSRETAEDVVQETLLSAHTAIDRFEGKSSVKTWLVSILRNKIIDHVRKHSRVQMVSYDSLTSDGVVHDSFNRAGIWSRWFQEWDISPDTVLEQKHFVERVKGCIRELPDSLRQVFVLRIVDDLSTDEICEQLEISANNFWVILYRSRMRLRKCLDVNWFNPKR